MSIVIETLTSVVLARNVLNAIVRITSCPVLFFMQKLDSDCLVPIGLCPVENAIRDGYLVDFQMNVVFVTEMTLLVRRDLNDVTIPVVLGVVLIRVITATGLKAGFPPALEWDVESVMVVVDEATCIHHNADLSALTERRSGNHIHHLQQ